MPPQGRTIGKIHGDVRVLGISSLLQALSTNKCQGYLKVSLGDQNKVIQFGSPGIRIVSGARRTNPLGEILLRSGRITILDLHQFLAEQRRTGDPLGQVIVRRGVLSQEDLESALREQVAEEIYDLFTWPDATFEFSSAGNGQSPQDQGPLSTVSIDASIMSISMEAARRIDELGRIRAVITDEDLLVERLRLPPALEDPGLDKRAVERILPLVDGKKTVRDLMNESFYPGFTVLRTLYGLAQRGVVGFRSRQDGTVRPGTPAEEKPADAPVASRGVTVLLISELPSFRAALALCLRRDGYDALEGGSVAELLQVAGRQKLDAIVLDMSIETEEGLTLLQGRAETQGIPLIVLADNSSKQAVTRAVKSGARHVLVKPVKEPVLLSRLSEAVKGRPAPPPAP